MVVTILVGLIPAGIVLDRRIAVSLLDRARADLAKAPRILSDRAVAWSDALMMHAKEVAHAPGLSAAVRRKDRSAAVTVLEAIRPSLGPAVPLVVVESGTWHIGPEADSAMVTLTRAGQMPVAVRQAGDVLQTQALAPIEDDGRWIGAAGVARPMDQLEAEGLKGLTGSEVILAAGAGWQIMATTIDTTVARAIIAAVRATPDVREVSLGDDQWLVQHAALDAAGSAVFVRSASAELALLPALRRTAALAVLGGALLALGLGSWLAARLSRPVRQLAGAAAEMAQGRFDAPLPDSRFSEVARVVERFEAMRQALRERLEELRLANEALQDRSARLAALQSDLMQRERLAAAGRLVAQLAHEIRNPVASLRNCLELVRRRLDHDPEGREFADLAINELLRMHELAEQMLDVSRPRAGAPAACRPVAVARDVGRLVTAGVTSTEFDVHVTGDEQLQVTMAPDALKQVLLNLVQNAREAMVGHEGREVRVAVAPSPGRVRIVVDDEGPGIADDVRARVFDPFFSTKTAVHGVGLGLFVAEGLVRGAGGTIAVSRAPSGGARVEIELPAVRPAAVPA